MRIVTQNGERDLPYEEYIISTPIDTDIVFADNVHHEGKFSRITLGYYNSHDDARDAAAEMRSAYLRGDSIFKMPPAT